jgi:hypothetical protein
MVQTMSRDLRLLSPSMLLDAAVDEHYQSRNGCYARGLSTRPPGDCASGAGIPGTRLQNEARLHKPAS